MSPSLHAKRDRNAGPALFAQHEAGFERGTLHRLVEGDRDRTVRLDPLRAVAGLEARDDRLDGREAPREVGLEDAIGRGAEPGRDARAVLDVRLQPRPGREAVERRVEPLALPGDRRVELQHLGRGSLLEHRERRDGAAELDEDLRLDRHLAVSVARDDVGDLQPAPDGERVHVVRWRGPPPRHARAPGNARPAASPGMRAGRGASGRRPRRTSPRWLVRSRRGRRRPPRVAAR